jgi:hypothetical protein
MIWLIGIQMMADKQSIKYENSGKKRLIIGFLPECQRLISGYSD